MGDNQPYFRFNPGAYEDGRSFERSSDVCEVCSRPCVWKYTGGVYAMESPVVCARCIANGELGKFLGDEHFSLHDIEISGAEPRLEKEVLQRTPGVACYNPFEWPVLDAKPLAFVGYGEDQGLLDIEAVRSAIDAAFEEIGRRFDGPAPYALVFKEIEGERYRVVIDLN
ncbi:CbrC family protein [Dongia deserti]|uniref:CbrC family protein n=1 Tax=Dongia deserti TaxID=2268030 RepID=UPI000E655962|nr:CbrC family protein [Dongia deserti]